MADAQAPLLDKTYTVFAGSRRLASGSLNDVTVTARQAIDDRGDEPVLIFDDTTGRSVDLDFRDAPAEKISNSELKEDVSSIESPSSAGGATRSGRPKLGVVSREVSLLPRHWEWLDGQPGSASATVRRLIDEARKKSVERDRIRKSQEAAFVFMSAMAGDRPGFEEAVRALFARNQPHFLSLIKSWPTDIHNHSALLAADSFAVDIEMPAK